MRKFKVWIIGAITNYWAYFYYRDINGIGETKSATNSFDQWKVGDIPNGATIIK